MSPLGTRVAASLSKALALVTLTQWTPESDKHLTAQHGSIERGLAHENAR